MSVQEVVPGLYQISLRVVNAFLLEDDEELVLIDTGIPGSEEKILEAVREMGRTPEDVKQILVTHLHADHTGSLAALKRATGAPAAMHPTDAAMTRQGKVAREMYPTGSLISRLAVRFMRIAPDDVAPAEIEHELQDDDVWPLLGGLRVIHVPGHAAGQVAFHWSQHGGVLIAADAAGNMMNRLGLSIVYEDVEEGKRSLQKLAAREFEVAVFGHGNPITHGASARFRKKWGK